VARSWADISLPMLRGALAKPRARPIRLGLMFFSDPVDGVREARRVLRRRAWVA